MKNTLKTLGLAAVIGLAATAAQADDKTLTVYTYDSFTAEWGPGPAIKKNFEAQCGCTLNWVAVDSSISILSKIQLEGASSKADVALGLDTNLVPQATENRTVCGQQPVARWPDPADRLAGQHFCAVRLRLLRLHL